MNERDLIERLTRVLGPVAGDVVVGIGDDAAVLPGGKLATVDMLVEGVHFDRAWAEPEDIGHKAIAVNLSDIAAMGGEPRYALVSLALPAGFDESWVEGLYRGMRAMAERYSVAIVGGNLARSPGPAVVDVTVLGDLTTAAPWLRSGARAGDLVAVTGKLGRAAAGLECLRRWGHAVPQEAKESVAAQLRPEPRIAEARALRSLAVVTSAIDVSDGLSNELALLAAASRVGFVVENVPVPEVTRWAAMALGGNADEWVWHGGEDYELLLTVPAAARASLAGIATVIGLVTEEVGVVRGPAGVVTPKGWDHFRSRG